MVSLASRLSLAATLALLSFSPALAQTQSNTETSPPYNLQTEARIKGTVEEVRSTGTTAKTKVAKLLFKNGSESIEIFLCPQPYLDDQGISFTMGDSLEITGSKVKVGEADEILAREIQKGNDTVILRDKKGKPVWN